MPEAAKPVGTAINRALTYEIEWHGHIPSDGSGYSFAIDGKIGIVRVVIVLDRRQRGRRADQDIMIFENWAERFIHLAAHQVNPVETIGT